MSEDNPWYRISFDFTCMHTEVDWDQTDRRALLLGLGKATAYLLNLVVSDPERRNTLGIYVKDLEVREVPYFTDAELDQALEKFRDDFEG